jgi:uncharacterized membrane protein
MLLSAVSCLLVGAVLGLKFNIRIIAHAAGVAVAGWTVVALVGHASVTQAVLGGVLDVFALQAGYYVSVVMAALGLTVDHDVPAAKPVAKSEPFTATAEWHEKT